MYIPPEVSRAEWAAALVESEQRAIARVEITDASGQVLYTSKATLAGSVTEDSTQSILRRCQVSLVDLDGTLTPTDTDDLVTPVGNELRLYRGLQVRTATPHLADIYDGLYDNQYGAVTQIENEIEVWVPLGVFGISRPEISTESGGAVITIAGYDRARRVQRARLTDTYAVAKNTDLADAIDALLRDRWPDCPTLRSEVPATTLTHRHILDIQSDPWVDGVKKLAAGWGFDVVFGVDGVPVLREIPGANGDPVATVARDLSGVMTSAERALDDENTYSGIVVTGESTSAAAPARGEAWDEDPSSPTYRFGPFGQVPYFYSNPNITSDAQAERTATAMLPRHVGIVEDASWEQIPNPALQTGDLIGATDPVIGLSGVFSLEAQTIGLQPADLQALTMKARRLTL